MEKHITPIILKTIAVDHTRSGLNPDKGPVTNPDCRLTAKAFLFSSCTVNGFCNEQRQEECSVKKSKEKRRGQGILIDKPSATANDLWHYHVVVLFCAS